MRGIQEDQHPRHPFREVKISCIRVLCVDVPCCVEYTIYRCVLLNWKYILTVSYKLRKGIQGN